jgi:lysophospholipase L1-like esterase
MPPIRRRILLTAALTPWAVAALAVLLACSREAIKGRAVPPGATVLALGDSLTFGTGAAPDTSYPSVLAKLTGWDVINAGAPGDTSGQALERTDALLAKYQPALVLLCIGGNDFLRRGDDAATRLNIRKLCEQSLKAGAQVLLIAVPRPTVSARLTGSLDDHPMFGELAEALRLPLHRQGWSAVLADETLRADPIHANAAGYAHFARGLVTTLRASGMVAG